MARPIGVIVGVLLALSSVSARGESPRDLLPDLVSLPAQNVQIQTGAYAADLPAPSLPHGCYPDERLVRSARRCLRFDLIVANEGDGPFELRFRLDGLAGGDARDVVQRIYRSDGGHRDRVADTYRFHPTHGHFHYERFAQAHLWASNAAGEPLGSEPVRSSRKVGFCMADMEWRYGGARPAYQSPRCRAPTVLDPSTGEVSLVNGISVGWADVYRWYLGDQYIEVSGVADGFYLLETIADADGTIAELDDGNNVARTLIRISGRSVGMVRRRSA